MKPHVLHICSDYSKQKIYSELVAELDEVGVRQFVYVPVRSSGELGVNRNYSLRLAGYRYSHILRPMHRLFFRAKIKRIVRDLLSHTDPASFTIVHAHFLYSDGAVALALNRACGLPYVVAVRNTDINSFMRLRPDLRRLCWEIVARARYVVFITPGYLDLLLRRAPRGVQDGLAKKARIVPNGLSEFWIDHAGYARPSASEQLKLLYVGDLSRNKNIATSIRATALLNEHRKTSLTLVGAGGDGEREIDSLLASGKYPFVSRVGRVDSLQTLAHIYRSHDIFVMPSFRETFGVAYLEAMSQGLPVIFSRGQGIDGYFEPGTVGEPVNPADAEEVKVTILAISRRLNEMRPECVNRARSFAWRSIAGTYLDLYRKASSLRTELGIQ